MQTLDFNELFTKGWEAFVRQIGMAIVWTLVYVIGTFILMITIIGIIILPVWIAGYLETMRAVWRGDPGEFGDFFKHMGKIGNLWAVMILMWLGVFVGTLLLIIPGIIVAVLWSQAIFLIIDKDLDAITAMTASWNRVKDDFWMVLAVIFVTAIISGLGSAVYIGWLVTFPFALLVSWAMYYALFPPAPDAQPAAAPTADYSEAPPPPPPPPPTEDKRDDEGITLE